MKNILNYANYINIKYEEIFHDIIDEMKLHKLLYFAQRENIAVNGKPLFNDEFQGWIFGPVSPLVRKNLYGIKNNAINVLTDEEKEILNSVILQYGPIDSKELSALSHSEISWINARKGLGKSERGNIPLSIEDITEDAKKTKDIFSECVSPELKKIIDEAEEEVKEGRYTRFEL